MKTTILLLVSCLIIITTGCRSATPKTLSRTPIAQGSYTYGQEPAKTVLADKGKIYDQHAKELQEMRLAHERELVAIEYEAERARVAKEKGITNSPPRAAVNPASGRIPPVSQQILVVPPGPPPGYFGQPFYVGHPPRVRYFRSQYSYDPPPVTLRPSSGYIGHRRVIWVRHPKHCR